MVIPFYQTTRVIGQKSKIKISYPQEKLNLKYNPFLRFLEVRILNHTTPDTYYDVFQVMNSSVYKNALFSNAVFSKLTSLRKPAGCRRVKRIYSNITWRNLRCSKQELQWTYNRSLNHCCCGKAIIITYAECVCVCDLNYPARKAHAPYNIVTWGLSGYTIFLHIIPRTELFFRKEVTDHKTRVLTFSTSLSETFLIVRRTERDTIKTEHWCLCQEPVILVRL
jgi:hypothetical protein